MSPELRRISSSVSTCSDLSDISDTASLSSSTSSLSTVARRTQRRVRAITLQPGTSFHDAFFGQDESARTNFDQATACAEICTRENSRRGQQETSTRSLGSTTSIRSSRSSRSIKAGRPALPRFGAF
ncbi:expressed unknown protein [Seminavis robusta]|uniref:Uncharacterized protein n=1 Tax=Seminavis robusta TaxID=568900 RepID=A0A9N8HG32_9STRA|nr:expressed unknown protein [Seminavis robusta]|eukprot:Sro378_g130320.1 n/a (127) ;mRNA; r:50080-50460